MKQNILKFNFKFKSNDFFVTQKNFFAYEYIKKWPDWNNQFVYIYGPEKCGKTLISDIWKDYAQALYISSEDFNKKVPDNLDFSFIKKNNWIIDDIDKLINEDKMKNNQKILNFINILKDNSNSYLLMTGKQSPKYIGCKLKDLSSRLLESVVIEVSNPDQELLAKIIYKYLRDRNITLSEKCLSYITDRVERSYESALKIAKKIDFKSLEKKSNITVYFLRSLLENEN